MIPIPNDIRIAVDSDKSSNPTPLPPLYMIKNEFRTNVNPTNTGNNINDLSKLSCLLRTVKRVIKNINPATTAENIGDKNHDNTIPDTPPIYGNESVSLYQITQSNPPDIIVIPIIPPTQE